MRILTKFDIFDSEDAMSRAVDLLNDQIDGDLVPAVIHGHGHRASKGCDAGCGLESWWSARDKNPTWKLLAMNFLLMPLSSSISNYIERNFFSYQQ